MRNYRLYRIWTAPVSERCSISNLVRTVVTIVNILASRQCPWESPTSLDIVKVLGASQGSSGSWVLHGCHYYRFACRPGGLLQIEGGGLVTEIHSLEISQPKKFNSSSPLTQSSHRVQFSCLRTQIFLIKKKPILYQTQTEKVRKLGRR